MKKNTVGRTYTLIAKANQHAQEVGLGAEDDNDGELADGNEARTDGVCEGV